MKQGKWVKWGAVVALMLVAVPAMAQLDGMMGLPGSGGLPAAEKATWWVVSVLRSILYPIGVLGVIYWGFLWWFDTHRAKSMTLNFVMFSVIAFGAPTIVSIMRGVVGG